MNSHGTILEKQDKFKSITNWLSHVHMPTASVRVSATHFVGNSAGVIPHDVETEEEEETVYPSSSTTGDQSAFEIERPAGMRDCNAQPGRIWSWRNLTRERKTNKSVPRKSWKLYQLQRADTKARHPTYQFTSTIEKCKNETTETATEKTTLAKDNKQSPKRRHSVHEEDDEPRKSRIVVSSRRSRNSEFPGLSMVI